VQGKRATGALHETQTEEQGRGVTLCNDTGYSCTRASVVRRNRRRDKVDRPMFGLALMTSSPFVKVQARILRSIKIPPGPFRPRGKVLKLPWPCPGYYGVMVRRPGALTSPGPPLLHIGRGVGPVLTQWQPTSQEHPPSPRTRGGATGMVATYAVLARGGRRAGLRGAGDSSVRRWRVR
jgi:hypothetical protein